MSVLPMLMWSPLAGALSFKVYFKQRARLWLCLQ